METLQEFVSFTKGWEYLIAIMFIALWLVFWTLFKGGSKTEAGKPELKQAELTGDRSEGERELVGSARGSGKST